MTKSSRKTSATAEAKTTDRLPPHEISAEQGILGCILLAPDSCIVECIQKIKPGFLAFYDLRHQTLFQAMVDMWEEMEPIDLITLPRFLKDRNMLEGIGGLAYLSVLPDMVPSAANLDYYIQIVLEKYLARKLVQTCTGIVQRVFENEGEMDEILDTAEADILKFSQERVAPTIISTKELVQRAIGKIEEYHNNQGALMGISTGFVDLDKMTCGLQGGEMIVIAARPSVGKSAIAMNIADHVCVELKLPVGIFSLEMSAGSLMMRMLCSRARVNIRNVRDGFLAERDFPRLTASAGRLSQAPLYIDDTPALAVLQLRAKARQMWQAHGIKLFIIDYMQLLQSLSRRAENRQQEVAQISGGIKALAKELNVPVIVLCQLNREVEKRGADCRPRLSELRESGTIEQDADLVGLMFRDAKKDDDDDYQVGAEAIPVKLFIAKQRNGPTGDVDLTFLKSITRFESAAKVSTEDANYKQPHND